MGRIDITAPGYTAPVCTVPVYTAPASRALLATSIQHFTDTVAFEKGTLRIITPETVTIQYYTDVSARKKNVSLRMSGL